MTKIWTIAVREYLAAVKTKGFVISLVLLPIFMLGGVFAGRLAEKVGDDSTYKVAVIDQTGGFVYDKLAAAVELHNTKPEVSGVSEAGDEIRQTQPRLEIERIDAADETALAAARLTLSERVREGELLGFAEIGPDLLTPTFNQELIGELAAQAAEGENPAAPATPEGASDDPLAALDFESQMAQRMETIFGPGTYVHYATNKPTNREFRGLMNRALQASVPQERMMRGNMNPMMVTQAVLLGTPPQAKNIGLYEQDAAGEVVQEVEGGQVVAGFAVPVGLLMLIFLTVMVGCSPMTTNVIEEKQLRIAEVLLAGVRPFELMMGKLVGGVGVALTLAAVYLGGAFGAAVYFNFAQYLAVDVMLWFVVFTILSALLFGAMFAAVGAAVTDIKEAQTLMTPVMLLLVIPLSMFLPIVQNPNGTLALTLGYFPFTAPLITVLRLAVPPGIPVWQILLAILSSLVGITMLIWAAGRIFRVGMLSTGKAPTPRELAAWVLKG
jgi:ABC-type Na+ efflux pump permease subunit